MELEVIREVDDAHLSQVRSLLDDAKAFDHHEPLGEHKWLDLVHGGREGFAGVVASDPGHDHLIGYAHVSRHPKREGAEWGLEIVVHPEHRGVGTEVALVQRALDLVAEAGGGHLHLWVFQPSEIHEGLAHRLGLTKGRDLLHMSVPLPIGATAELPDGVTLRPFEPGPDEQAWLDVNNRAFGMHPEQGAWDRDTLERRMAEPWFNAAGFLLAVKDDHVVGFCWTKLNPHCGEIYVIGVEPDHHGGGLGKALVIAGLASLHEQGATMGCLYVDAAQDAAVGLYRKLGFEIDHVDRAYATDVTPA